MDLTPALNKSSNQIENLKNLSDDCHDKDSFWDEFGWVRIFQKYMIPFIVRVINDERIKFVSVRMVTKDENIQKYLNFFRPDIMACVIVKFQFMTHVEAIVFNEINKFHCDNHYRKFSTKDYIIRYEDLPELYKFTKFCYETLSHNTVPNEKYGFMQIDYDSVIPYIIKDNIKYTPLFYFEYTGVIKESIKITDWNLSYLKFCCKIQGLVEWLYSGDTCDVISIDDIRCYLSELHFEEFRLDYNKHIPQLINNEPANALFNDWIEPHSEIIPATENTTLHTSTTPVIPHSMSVITNGQEMIANQMGLSEIQQGSSAINSVVKVPQLPSPSTSAALSKLRNRKISSINSEIIDLTSPPSSPAPNNQQEKVYTPNSAIQFGGKFEQMLHDTSKKNAYKGLSEIQQGSSAINSVVKVPQLPSPSPSTSAALSKLRNRNISSINSEMIDLTSPPSSPAPNNQQEKVYTPISAVQFKRKSEQMLHGTSKKNAYKGLSEIQQGSSAINSVVKVPQLPSPSPSTSAALSKLKNRKISSINSEIIDLTSPPSSPAPNNQQEKVYTPNSAIQYMEKSEQMLHDTSEKNAYKGLSEIQQGSSAINSVVKVPQLPSPSPSTSAALSKLKNRKISSINSEIIDLTSPPSSPAPNNQQEKFYTPNSAIQYMGKSEQILHGTSMKNAYKGLSVLQQGSNAINSIVKIPTLPSPSPSTTATLRRYRIRKISSINSEMIDLTSPPSSPAPNNQ